MMPHDGKRGIPIDDSDSQEDTLFAFKSNVEPSISLLNKRFKSPFSYHIRRSELDEKYRTRAMQRYRKQLVSRVIVFASCFLLVFWYFGGFSLFNYLYSQPRLDRPIVVGDKTTFHRVKVDVYGESHCPDTTRFWNKQLVPAFQDLSDVIQLNYYAFGKARCIDENDHTHKCTKEELLKDNPPSLYCQHAQKECDMNALQNCVQHAAKIPSEWVPILACLQGNDVSESVAKKCIPPEIGAQAMLQCQKSTLGAQLMAKAGLATISLDPPMHRIPWVVVDGEYSSGAEYNLKEEVCNRITGEKPNACR